MNIRTSAKNGGFFSFPPLEINRRVDVCKLTLKKMQINLVIKYLIQVLYTCYEFDLLMAISIEI